VNFSKRNLVILSLVALMVIPVSGVLAQDKGSGQQNQPTVVATVNDAKITQQELSQAAQMRQITFMAMRRQLPQKFATFLLSNEEGRKFIEEYQKYVLDFLIDEEIKAQKAEELGITVSDKEVDEAVQKQVDSIINRSQQYKSEEDLAKAYESQTNRKWKDYKENIRTQQKESLKISKLQEEVTGDIQVTDTEIKNFYENNKQSFSGQDGVKPLEEVRGQIESTLKNQKRSQEFNKWLQEEREKAEIEKDLEGL